MIIILEIDNRLSQITDIQKEPSTQNIIIQAYAIAEQERETYTCVPEYIIYTCYIITHLQTSSQDPSQLLSCATYDK